MAENAVVRARIDERTKREAAAALKKIGLTLSDAFRLLLVRVAAEKALPFEPLKPNAATVAAMKAARRGRARQGRQAGPTAAQSECARLNTPLALSVTPSEAVMRDAPSSSALVLWTACGVRGCFPWLRGGCG